jgi:alkylation response protein AidB-like acyl-CoA dehydrogenase
MSTPTVDEVLQLVRDLLARHPPASTERLEFLRARFDAGLAWVHFPTGLGGLGASRELQVVVDAELAAAGAPDNNMPRRLGIGLGMVAPTILRYGTPEQHRRYLRPLWIGEEVWCQLFSEPGAGSDLAGLATRAVRDGDEWVVTGQKVWNSVAHIARFGALVARTDPDAPKHQGITYFICDMTDPGVEVRPLRQLTGQAEFNEVYLTGVRIPDANRLGAVGEGWQVARTTLMNERLTLGSIAGPREDGVIGIAARAWREHPELRTPELHDRIVKLWVEAEVTRLVGQRLRQQLAASAPGPEGSALKLAFSRLQQAVTGFEVEFRADDGLLYDDWAMSRSELMDLPGRGAGYRYLRTRANSIEGGTSEVLRNIIAERVLGMPSETRVDKDIAWKDIPR